MSEISVSNLTVTYKNKKKEIVTAIDDLSIIFPNEEISVIIGPSGCGKTTLLRAILGLQDYEGTICLDGVDLFEYSIGERNFAYVNQKIALHPKMTIFDNIAFPLRVKGMEKVDIVNEVNKIAKELGIEACLSRKPKQISIGQAQRAALARALIKRANFYLFDEPLSNLDEQNKFVEKNVIKEVCKKYGASLLYVTHDIKEATSLGDHIYVMDEGKIIFSGTSKELFMSENPLIQELVRSNGK